MLRTVGAALVIAVGSLLLAAAPSPRTPPPHASANPNAHKSSAPKPGMSEPTPSPSPERAAGGSAPSAVSEVVRIAGGAAALLSFDDSHADKADAWAVRAFVETGSLEAAFASLVSAPDKRRHVTVYCEPRTYGGRNGIVVSVALLGKDATRSEKLASGERVVVRVWQLRARKFEPPLQFRSETP